MGGVRIMASDFLRQKAQAREGIITKDNDTNIGVNKAGSTEKAAGKVAVSGFLAKKAQARESLLKTKPAEDIKLPQVEKAVGGLIPATAKDSFYEPTTEEVIAEVKEWITNWREKNAETTAQNTAAAEQLRATSVPTAAGTPDTGDRAVDIARAGSEGWLNALDEPEATEMGRGGNIFNAATNSTLAAFLEGIGLVTSQGKADIPKDVASLIGEVPAEFTDNAFSTAARDKLQGVSGKAYNASDTLSRRAEKNTTIAKEGLGTIGSFLVDTGIAGVQLAGDIGIGALTGGGALLPMGLRSFGMGVQQARLDGASQREQFIYGLGSAAVEILTERIASVSAPFKAFGKGSLDDIIEGTIKNMTQNQSGRLALTALAAAISEGGEEVISAFVNPALQYMTYDESAMGQYAEREFWSDMLSQALVGGVLGLVGTTGNVINTMADNDEAGKWLNDAGALRAVIETGLESAPGTESNRLAELYSDKNKLSNRRLGRLYNANVEAVAAENAVEDVQAARDQYNARGEAINQQIAELEAHPEMITDEVLRSIEAESTALVEEYQRITQLMEAEETKTESAPGKKLTLPGIANKQQTANISELPPLIGGEGGGKTNVTENYTAGSGTDADGIGQGRLSGESAVGQTGRLDGGAKQEPQSIAARRRQDILDARGVGAVSAKEIGLWGGSDAAALKIVPDDVISGDAELANIRTENEAAGYTTHFYVGMAMVNGVNVEGWVDGTDIWIQTDRSAENSRAAKISAHEMFHAGAAEDPGRKSAVARELIEKYGRAELESIIGAYVEKYAGIVDMSDESIDESTGFRQSDLYILEEIFADAVAGRNRFGQKAGKYQEDIKRVSAERDAPAGRETAEATARKTGPPEAAASASEDGRIRLPGAEEAEKYSAAEMTAEERYEKAFEERDGKIYVKDVSILTEADLNKLGAAMRRAGYDWRGVDDVREMLSRFAERNGALMGNQVEAIKRVYGKTEAEKAPESVTYKKAEKIFGTTTRWSKAGYLMTDGKLLDFSGKREGGPANVRQMDHREIAEAYDRNFDGYSDAMIAFMDEGNIRMQAYGFELTRIPTKAQSSMLREFIIRNNGEVIVDLGQIGSRSNPLSVEYPIKSSATRILNDIKEYYENGKEPVISDMQRFRYSVADDEDYAPVFYSKAEQVVEAYKGDKIAAGSLVSYLRGHGVKAEEIKWSGIEQWLEGKKSVTKSEVMEYLRANQLQIEEVTKSGRDPGWLDAIVDGLTPFFQGISDENNLGYDFADADDDFVWRAARYWVDNVPPEEVDFASYDELSMYEEAWNKYVKEDYNPPQSEAKYEEYALEGGTNYREMLFTLPDYNGVYPSPHWSEENVLAHTRLQDFKDATGSKVLFIDEIQSDWHQAGREKGYRRPELEEEARLLEKYHDIQRQIDELFRSPPETADVDDVNAVAEQGKYNKRFYELVERQGVVSKKLFQLREKIQNEGLRDGGAVPDAPYRTTWHEFVLKRILRMAAEGGYDKVAWTTGQMQADRYNLSKDINYIEARKTSFDERYYLDTGTNGGMQIPQASGYKTEKEIIELFGKELGGKIIKGADENGKILIYDDGLSIGGEGMKAFYDVGGRSSQNIPKFLDKYVKQWGSRVSTAILPDVYDPDTYANLHADGHDEIDAAGQDFHEGNGIEVAAVEITPEMKRSVLYEGQPRYSVAEDEEDYALSGKTANYKPETLDRLFDNYSIGKNGTQIDYAQRYVAYISPEEFLALTTVSNESRERIANSAREQYGEFDTGKMGDVRSVGSPYLTFDLETGEVLGHEGRHRMSLLEDAGIERVAITLHPYPNEEGKYSRKKFDALTLTGEEFSNGKSEAEVTVENVLPLSRRYESEVRAVYGSKAAVKYSAAEIPTRKDIRKIEATARKNIQKEAAAAFSIRSAKRSSNILEFTLSKIARGEVTEAELDDTFEALFAAGEVYDNSEVAREYKEIAEELQGRRIYITPQVKLEFGDDWNPVRQKAFGNKVYFTNNPKDLPLDSSNVDLAASFPGYFAANETDPAAMIESMIRIWDNAKSQLVSIEAEARKFGGETAVEKYRDELRTKFMKMVADYDQKVNGAKAARTQALQAARETGEKEIAGYIEEARQKMRERAEEGLPAPTPVRFYAEEGMSYEDYISMIEAKAKDARAARVRTVPKEEFSGTPIMGKYGVRIEGSVTDYRNVDQLRENNKAVRSVKKALQKAEKRLRASDKERKFASGVASGYYTEADIPSTMDTDKVMELADFYMAERAIGTSLIMQRRFDIYKALDEKVYADWSDSEEYSPAKFGKFSKLIMNERQPERVLMSIYGRDKGGKLFRDYFWPVETNEAGRLRFINGVLDQVRTFKDKNGKERALTAEEDALAMKVKEGRAVGEIVASMEMKQGIHNAAENLRKSEVYKKAEREGLTKKERDVIDKALGRAIADEAQEFGLGTEERNLVRHYARWLETQDALENADGTIIDNAVKVFDGLYNNFYEMINQVLIAHGYEPIGFIPGYAPHMQTARTQESLLEAFKALGVNTDIASALPTSIAGETANFKPNMRYNPYFQTRTGDFTHYSITQGLESYVTYMSDAIFHIDDIMRLRRVEKYMRSSYAPEELSDQIELANGLRYAPAAMKAAYLQNAGVIEHSSMLNVNDINDIMEGYIEELYGKITNVSKYGEFTTWLNNYINIQAGKQSLADRGLEYNGGRAFLNLGNKIMRLFAQRNVGGNISSMINQFAQLPLIESHLGVKYIGRAIVDIARGEIRRGDFMERSDFLTGKEGIEWVTQDNYDKFIKALFAPMTLTDTLLSTIAVRGEYLRLLDRGYSDADALKGADAFGRRAMASRMKGVKPQGFESKAFIQQMIHVFQVEASNTFDYMFVSTLPNEIKDTFRNEGKQAGFKKLAAVIVGYLLTAFIQNRLTDALTGGTPAPYDMIGLTSIFLAAGKGLTPNTWIQTVIDNGFEKLTGERLFDTEPMDPERKFEWSDAWNDLTWNTMNDVPYTSNITGVAGFGDRTLPTVGINEFWGYIKAIWPDLTDTTDEDGTVLAPDWWSAIKHLVAAVSQLAPGGRQVNKTWQGLELMARGGKYSGTGEDARLIYPVEQTAGNWLQALIFGPSAMEETSAYYAGDDNGLTARQTRAYEELKDDGVEIETILEIDDKWNEIKAEDMSAVEKATTFARWVDDQGYSEERAALIKESWVFTSGFVAEAEGYDNYKAAGLDEDAAYEIATAILNLEPLPGKLAVSDAQRYDAILSLGLSDKEKELAMGVVMGLDSKAYEKLRAAVEVGISLKDYVEIRQQDYAVDRYLKFMESGTSSDVAVQLARDIAELEPEELDENGEGTVSDLQRYRSVVNSGVDLDEQVAAFGALMQEAEYTKITTAYDYGVSPEMYVTVKEYIKEIDENGSTTQAEARSAIDKIPGLSTNERAVLWQLVNKSWSAASNPYNTGISAQVRDALQSATTTEIQTGGTGLTLPGFEEDNEDEEDNMTDYRLTLPGIG